jgi:uncharacterized protein (TIGR03435 family)
MRQFRSKLFAVTLIAISFLPVTSPVRAQSKAPLAFETASVKVNKSPDPRDMALQYLPGGRFSARGVPIPLLILEAYQASRLVPSPEFQKLDLSVIERSRYDIQAVAAQGTIPPDASSKVRNDKIREMLQALLADRFKLKVHREKKEQPVYAIVVAKNGPKLQSAQMQEKDCAGKVTDLADPASCHIFGGGQGQGLHGQAVDMSDLAVALSRFADKPVVDKTGLTGLYNIQTVGWVPLVPRPPRPDGGTEAQRAEDQAFADPNRATLNDVLDKLGLKLETQNGIAETVVVDYVAAPTEN